jgi:hypothetical protein
MISTRLHGMIDYAVASLLGGLSALRSLPPPVRGVLGAAGAYHASYSVLTDYEAGLRGRLTMRQHLALDALGGAALCAAGLLMRRQPRGGRALLIAAGLSELAVVALSSTRPRSGPGQGSGPVERLLGSAEPSRAGYPPLDRPKRVANDVFVVDSLLPGVLGKVLPVRMTVIRLPNGDLLLHSPTRFSPGLKRELETLGRIRHLVAPNVAHWSFLEPWQRACPEVTTWAAPGLRERSQVRRSGVRLDHDLGDTAPSEWDGIGLVMVPGGMGFHEAALFHQPTRTLVLTDLILNLDRHKLPGVMRPVARLLGILAPDGMPPPYLRAVIKLRRHAAVQAASRLLALQPERVIFAHGRWFEQGGAGALRRSLRWLLG